MVRRGERDSGKERFWRRMLRQWPHPRRRAPRHGVTRRDARVTARLEASARFSFVLARFEPVSEALSAREQARVMDLLVERVDYDGAKGKVAISFHSAGIKTLAGEMVTEQKGRSA